MGRYFPETGAHLCPSYLFYGGDGDNKEEGQAAGDWAGGGVDDKLRGERTNGRGVEEETTQRGGRKIWSEAKLGLEDKAHKIAKRAPNFVSIPSN